MMIEPIIIIKDTAKNGIRLLLVVSFFSLSGEKFITDSEKMYAKKSNTNIRISFDGDIQI